jgi:hypothetical protein
MELPPRRTGEGVENFRDEELPSLESRLPTEELFRSFVRDGAELVRPLTVRPVASPEREGLFVEGFVARPVGCLKTRLWPCVK